MITLHRLLQAQDTATSAGGSSEKRRIDVHHHIAPPVYVEELAPMKRLTPQSVAWTIQKSIDQMDEAGVATSITSVTTPGLWLGSHASARRLARACNEYAAKMVADHPGRFGMFVNVPLPDVEGALMEIAYGMDVLKADGVSLFTSYIDKWLGDPKFDEVFAELNRRKAVVYTHPISCACCTNLVPGIPDAAIEYGTDTSRAIARFIFSGSAKRYPDIKIIWSHGGGTMPFLIDRYHAMARLPQHKEITPDGFLPVARKFYYDTAQIPNKPALMALKEVVTADNILFGTDFPWLTSAHHVKGITGSGVFSPDELRAIDYGNTLRILPKYAR
ncbi:MAG: amidohydrolase family protein [Burkholderiales bacterium]